MKKILTILLAMMAAAAYPQEFTLQQIIKLAQDSSLTAFRYTNMYMASVWTYKSYRASRLPSLTLDLTPVSYNRQLISRYDSENDIDVYRQQKSYSAGAGLTLSQNFAPLGGTFYVSTNLNYLRYFGANTYNQFSTVPFSIGYMHNSFGFNQFKWEKKIEPIKFEKAKLQYLYNTEQIAQQAISYFFQLALSQAKYSNALEQKERCDSLYAIGQRRFSIASITKAELQTLRLDVLNAKNSIDIAQVEMRRNMLRLTSFLGMDRNTEISLVLPDNPAPVEIDVQKALELMHANSYLILDKLQSVRQAEMELDRIKKTNRVSAGVSASVGYNQEAQELADAYKSPMRRDVISVQLQVPLLDWGVRKGQKNQAINNLEVAKIDQEQTMDELEQNVINSIGELSTRFALLSSAGESLQLAREVYEQNAINFQKGTCNIITLSDSQSRLQNAQNQYITSMSDYWSCYYDIRSQTLFDFATGKSLSQEFDESL